MKTTKIKSLDGKELTFLTPTQAELASLAWRPMGAGYPVAFTDESAALIDQMTRGSVVKGGPGSGNHGHAGIPGHQGGSKPTDGKDYPRALELNGGKTMLSGDLSLLADYRLTPEDLEEILDLGIDDSTVAVYVKYSEKYDALKIMGTWTDAEGGTIGEFIRLLHPKRNEVDLNLLSFEGKYMRKGLGTRAAEQWFRKLAEKGYERAVLWAGLEVGRYAWAKEGAQYDDGDNGYTKAKAITRQFKKWADHRKLSVFEDGDYPTFENPQDVANYKHPSGYKMTGRDIFNAAVPSTLQMDLGKAFMLDKDTNAHGGWQAIINLKNWEGRGKAYKAVALAVLAAGGGMHYVEGDNDGSDALFWSQHLRADEGEPMFGFVQVSSNKRSHTIKGGKGSGNYGHAGIPGHQGGSQPTGADSVEGSTNQKTKPLEPLRVHDGSDDVDANEKLLSLLHDDDEWHRVSTDHKDTGLRRYSAVVNQDEALKDRVNLAMAKELGVSPNAMNNFMYDWSLSSNDSHLPSLMHQSWAAKHFGTNLSDWQKEKIKYVKALRKKEIDSYVDDLFGGWSDDPVDGTFTLGDLSKRMDDALDGKDGSIFLPFEADVMRKMMNSGELGMLKDKTAVKALLKKIERQSEALTKKAIKSIYARTQKKLADAGITEILLYRGAVLPSHQVGVVGEVGTVLDATTNALSSWSASEYTADTRFAHQHANDYKGPNSKTGVVLSAIVPASRIYSIPATGQGTLPEWEVILIGSTTTEPVLIKTTYKDKRHTL